MNYSQTYLATIVSILAFILPKLGIEIGSEALTTTIQTILVVGSGIWIMVRRYQAGGVTKLGVKK